MKATEILKDEHRVIERVITALEKATDQLQEGTTVRPAFFLYTVDFIKNYADGCHHRKEEGVLFEAMAEQGVPVRGGPIGCMLVEHEQGRRFTRALLEATEYLNDGEQEASDAIIHNARSYIELLRQHILKEDNVLFPMADQVIPIDKQEQINQDFEQIGQQEIQMGVREKYLALALSLEEEVIEM